MKKILFILLLFAACHNRESNIANILKPEGDSHISDSSITNKKNITEFSDPSEFLGYFIAVDKPDLFIQYETSPVCESPFGKAIDEKFYDYIYRQGFGTKNPSPGSKCYAYYKFHLSDNKIGLIIRHPWYDGLSDITLLSYNTDDSTLTNILELAFSGGDAGYMWEMKSWIRDIDSDSNADIVQHKKIYRPSKWEDATSTTGGLQYDTICYYKGEKGTYIKCYATASMDSLVWSNSSNSYYKIRTLKADTVFFTTGNSDLIDFSKYKK